MTVFHDDGQAVFHLGDCRAVMATMEESTFDAIVTDPPYGLGFMGKEWDSFSPASVIRETTNRERKGTERTSNAWPDRAGGVQGGGVAIRYDETAAGHRRFQTW